MIAVKQLAKVFVDEHDAHNIAIGTDFALSIGEILLARKANLPKTPGAPGLSFRLATTAGPTMKVGLQQVGVIRVEAQSAVRLSELIGAGKIAGAGNLWFMAVENTGPVGGKPEEKPAGTRPETPPPPSFSELPHDKVVAYIAQGHAFDKHVAGASEKFRELGLDTPEKLANHLKEIILAESTLSTKISPTKYKYYDQKTGTIIVINYCDPHGGSTWVTTLKQYEKLK